MNQSSDKLKYTIYKTYGPLVEFILSVVFIVSALVTQTFDGPGEAVLTLLLLSMITGGYRIVKKAVAELRTFHLGINVLMTLAVSGAMLIDEWLEAAVVIVLFALAEWLESFSLERARKSIESLFDVVPETALVLVDGREVEMNVHAIEPGMTVRIKPGARIPVDGKVIRGQSTVDQSSVTGESVPVEKRPDDLLFSGTLNHAGMLEMGVLERYEHSTIARIIELVETAQSKKSRAQKFIDRFSKYYTPAVVAVSLSVMAIFPLLNILPFSEAFYRALVLLVIACPCALVISTPVAVTSGLYKAARNGILIKGGVYLESFSRMKAMAFDKTGTITYGKPVVERIISLNGYPEEEILRIAASLESFSEHVLAQSILEQARKTGISYSDPRHFNVLPGLGIEGELDGKTYRAGSKELYIDDPVYKDQIGKLGPEWSDTSSHVIIGTREKLLGMILLTDTMRSEAPGVVRELRKLGFGYLIMLSGDQPEVAERIARAAGMDEYVGGLLPDQKLETVERLEQTYRHIAMIGDGINDAPALAKATIGLAMGRAGTDLALETADIVLMHDDLKKLPYLRRLSTKTVRTIKENIFIALFLKALFFALAIPGMATLWMAVFADMGASLIVIFNGLKLMKYR